jgi:hypothetical protein
VANGLSREQWQSLARLGAHARLAELEAERRTILAAFPGLAAQAARHARSGRAASGAPAHPGAVKAPAEKGGRRRIKMSAEQRKAVSDRMRKFWAERRKAAEA